VIDAKLEQLPSPLVESIGGGFLYAYALPERGRYVVRGTDGRRRPWGGGGRARGVDRGAVGGVGDAVAPSCGGTKSMKALGSRRPRDESNVRPTV
jgi:hypothetical protein